MKINFSTISERLADTYGDREAIVNIERNRRYSFQEFHLLTNQIINMMRSKLNLHRGDRWVNILDNDNNSLLHFFTAFKGEATACYTNYRDNLDEHTHQINTVHAKVVFLERDLLATHYEMLYNRHINIVCMDKPEVERPGVRYFWDLLEGVSEANPNVTHDDRSDPIIMRFTGGTTGRGKCAVYSIDNWLMCRDSFFALPDPVWSLDSRILHLAPISHGSGMTVLPTLFKGGCNITMNAPSLDDWCDNVAKEKVTMAFMVPTLLYRLLGMDAGAIAKLKSLATIYYGAAPISPKKLEQLQKVFGNIFIQVYGSTEHAGIALSMSKPDHMPFQGNIDHLASAGRAAPGVEIDIMDDDGTPVKRGEIGEIWMRSRATCLGYFNDAKQTESEFQDGFWQSGDLGQMDKRGFVAVVDRKKDMIISGGFNVYATEVEAAVNSHPAVLMSAVVGIPDEEWGEGVHAEVQLQAGETLDANELRSFIRKELGGYKTPKTIEFVEALPVSVVGKVLRKEVRSKYWQNTQRNIG